MDYNLKKENRKKFQDKTKLKRHHKKDYRKVVKTDITSNEEDEIEIERERQYDIEGNPILFSDEELDLENNIVLKGTTNDYRYKESLLNLDDVDLKDYGVDFKKEVDDDFDLGKKEDLKNMKTRDLLNLKIVDSEFDKEVPLVKDFEYEWKPTALPIKYEEKEIKAPTKIPLKLKSDEDFLDDLL